MLERTPERVYPPSRYSEAQPQFPCATPECGTVEWEQENLRKCIACRKYFCADCLSRIGEELYCAACGLCPCGEPAADACSEGCGELRCKAHLYNGQCQSCHPYYHHGMHVWATCSRCGVKAEIRTVKDAARAGKLTTLCRTHRMEALFAELRASLAAKKAAHPELHCTVAGCLAKANGLCAKHRWELQQRAQAERNEPAVPLVDDEFPVPVEVV